MEKEFSIHDHFNHVHNIIFMHRSRALHVVNNESLQICWNVGRYISEKLNELDWGGKVVNQLSEYLRTKDPSLKGFSRRNLYNMVSFYESYSSPAFINIYHSLSIFNNERINKEYSKILNNLIVQFETAQFETNLQKTNIVEYGDNTSMPEILYLINWTNHVQILNSCKAIEERIFYILYASKERLQIKELKRAIKTNAYLHILNNENVQSKGMAIAYPDTKYLFKDVAYLDFLGLPQKHTEKHLQKGILENMKAFILELGKDFLFVAQEYPLHVGDKTYKIDLLFYHRGLQCLVAIELKSAEFEPGFMGQLEFYLEALDQDVKRSNENPSIGILLCKEANREIVKYALNRSLSPTMIAKYERELIPKDVLQKSLSTFIDFMNNNETLKP